SVRTDGIHPARRIGIMILERSKRSRLRFVMNSPTLYAAVWPGTGPLTVNLLTPSRKGEFGQFDPRFQGILSGETRDGKTSCCRNCEPIRDCCVSTRCDGDFHGQVCDFWIDATAGNCIMSR